VFNITEPLFYFNRLGETQLSPGLLELDTMCLGLALLTVAHATLHRRLLRLMFYLTVALHTEHFLIRVHGVHCHREALLMISQCSSANSIALYVPALYSCHLASERLPLHRFARPFATGLLLCLYALPYLQLGVAQGWWAYVSSKNGTLALQGGAMWTLNGLAEELEAPSKTAAALSTRCASTGSTRASSLPSSPSSSSSRPKALGVLCDVPQAPDPPASAPNCPSLSTRIAAPLACRPSFRSELRSSVWAAASPRGRAAASSACYGRRRACRGSSARPSWPPPRSPRTSAG
jgi:hypothetical protein